MAVVQIDPYSQVPLFIKLLFGDTELATATAFFYRSAERLYLVSNWHNFAGRDPETGTLLAAHAGVPNRVHCYACLPGDYVQRAWIHFPLVGEEAQAVWLEHPEFGRAIDLGVLPVDQSGEFQSFAVNDVESTPLELRVSQDVFVLGYPFGLQDAAGLPVWKRASVATEPSTSSPLFLVDTATRRGMSGSPVVLRYWGFHKTNPELLGVQASDWFGEASRFVGVYSGRVGRDETQAQLGRVWKSRLIEEIIAGNKPAMTS